MTKGTKNTVGAIAVDLMQQEAPTRNPIELEREMHKPYEQQVIDAVNRGKQELLGDFYIVVLTKKEPLLPNVLRNYFFARKSCPTPEYDQTVYSYDRAKDTLTYLWVVPSKDTCELFRANRAIIAQEEYGLLQNVLSFYDGSLFALAKKLNNERADSPLLDR